MHSPHAPLKSDASSRSYASRHQANAEVEREKVDDLHNAHGETILTVAAIDLYTTFLVFCGLPQ